MLVAIHQPMYVPYPGFFNKIKVADKFVLYDTAQFVKHRWDNRNRIKGNNQEVYLTIPVGSDKSWRKTMQEVVLPHKNPWRKKHYRSLEVYYAKAPFWQRYQEFFHDWYFDSQCEYLVEFNRIYIQFVMQEMGIDTPLVLASELGVDHTADKSATRLIIDMVKTVGGTGYLSGVSGGSYMETQLFDEQGIALSFQDYTTPAYHQLGDGFIANLSSIDMLLNEGDNMANLI
jgi:hypothetical protein